MANKTITTVIKSDFVSRVKDFVEGDERLDGLGLPTKINDPDFVVDPDNPGAPVPQIDNPVTWDLYLPGAMMSEIFDRMYNYEAKKARDANNQAFKASQQSKIDGKDAEKNTFIS